MNRILLILSLVILASCNHETPNASKESPPQPSYHGNDIGEIPFDAQTDNPEFSFCDSNRIYHSRGALKYEGDGRPWKRK
ncbi:hypothetical protein KFE98_19535 [bacterium SCSIO 12741]|nr:hypothetical protein KFE98_19535 [bacterium SCSIO 12741]